jgi:hypothetical protein
MAKTEFIGLVQGSLKDSEQNNAHLNDIKSGEFTEYLSSYFLLNKGLPRCGL